MYRKSISKWLAVLLTAACTLTVTPQTTSASELLEDEPILFTDEFVTADSDVLLDYEAGVGTVEEAAAPIEDAAGDFDSDRELEEDIVPDGALTSGITEADLNGAAEVTLNTHVIGNVASESKVFYKFTPNKTGIYLLNASSTDEKSYEVFDIPEWNKGISVKALSEKEVDNEALDLRAGVTYYIMVKGSSSSKTEDFTFTLSFKEEVEEYDADAPKEINFGQEYKGKLYPDFRSNHDYINAGDGTKAYGHHYYKFVVQKHGRLTFTSDSSDKGIYWSIKDVKDVEDAPEKKFYWRPEGSSAITGKNTYTIDLIPATYYVKLDSSSEYNYTEYSFKMTFKEIKAEKDEKPELDNVFGGSRSEQEQAVLIDMDQKYVAQSSCDNENRFDWYKFTLTGNSRLHVSLSSEEVNSLGFYMYKGNGDPISLYPTDAWQAGVGKSLVGQPVCTSYPDSQSKKPSPFAEGTYYFAIQKHGTGNYKFEISTKEKTPITGLKVVGTDGKTVTSVAVPVNKTISLNAIVLPETAYDRTVTWVSDDTNVATVENGVITGLKGGCKATITVTTNSKNKSGKPLTAKIKVDVVDVEISELNRLCDLSANVVSKEKVNLISDDYFGKDFKTNKNDKWIVLNTETGKPDKTLGSVAKGVFTGGKTGGQVTVVRQVKVGKTYVDSGKVTFTNEVPKYFKDEKKKDIKTANLLVDKGAYVMPEQMIDFAGATVLPDYYECSDKKNANFDFNPATGVVVAKKSGSCKITAYYGSNNGQDKKNAGKIEYTVKAKIPTVKDITVKNIGKITKDKKITVTVGNVSKEAAAALKAENWSIESVKLVEDESGKHFEGLGTVPELITFNPIEKGGYTKCELVLPPGTAANQYVAVTLTINGVQYTSYVSIF